MDFELRKYLTKNSAEHMNKLMERIEKYKRLENDQLQAWSKGKLIRPKKKKKKERRMDSPPPMLILYFVWPQFMMQAT